MIMNSRSSEPRPANRAAGAESRFLATYISHDANPASMIGVPILSMEKLILYLQLTRTGYGIIVDQKQTYAWINSQYK